MDQRVVNFILARLVLAAMAVLCVPMFLAMLWGEWASVRAFSLSLGLAVTIFGYLFTHARRKTEAITRREGIAITAFGWGLITALGMMPYLFGGHLGLLDALFESISGFTTTGSTVIPSIEALPASILFWRSMTHWFGGLGIIVIFIALLPQAGQSTVYMYQAEASGRDRVLPRLRDMTGALFRMYAGLTALCAVIYWLCGLDAVTAVNHAFSTLGAGGFSTYDANAMAFDDVWLEGWMAFFMFVAGGNFGLYYKIWKKGPHALRKNTEFRAYLGLILVASALVAGDLVCARGYEAATAMRYAIFQTTSLSTTGFVSADFDTWPAFSKGVLLLLMFLGGCSGSTASGLKIHRAVLLVKNAAAILHEKLHPRALAVVHMNGHQVDVTELHRTGNFFFLYVTTILAFGLVYTLFSVPMFDAFAISVTTLGNVGPAFGVAGATQTYAPLPDVMKAILCLEMLLGRLEIFTLAILLRPEFWRGRK
ncbi:TrkH family potassium uptake protein [uncultured Selenomonas sp.]|uniref:TrkH family potassium uptake protein n=1 Tax=uncultured Selenomonas sp. TaxID=159275 RepID=UPI0025D57716|nr:TrkH family potassium uptake protein [uncultured Selenomonas sp.]